MKTKLLTGISIILFALSTSLFADSCHHQEESFESTTSSGGMTMIDMMQQQKMKK